MAGHTAGNSSGGWTFVDGGLLSSISSCVAWVVWISILGRTEQQRMQALLDGMPFVLEHVLPLGDELSIDSLRKTTHATL